MNSLSQRRMSRPTTPSAWQPTLPDGPRLGKPRCTWGWILDIWAEAAVTPRQSQSPDGTILSSLHQHCLEELLEKNRQGYCHISSKEKEFTFVEMLKDFGRKKPCSYLHNFTCTDTQVQMLSWKLWLHNSINFVWVLRIFLGAFRNLQEVLFIFIYV